MDQTDLSNRSETQDDGTKNVLLEEANMAAANPRMRNLFETETTKALQEKFAYASSMQMPKPVKVVINMGLGRAQQNPKILESAVAELEAITGQKAVTCLPVLTNCTLTHFLIPE